MTISAGIRAQSSQETFGKNRVQYQQFDWKSINTKNFEVYYYGGGNELAHNTARMLETDYQHMVDALGYSPYSKIVVIVYNSISDLQQSNLGLVNVAFIGGNTTLVKSKIEIAFHGNLVDYRNELNTRVGEMLVNLMMFGGNFKEMVQNSYLLNLPDWFLSGAARYAAEGRTVEMDNVVRDVLDDKHLEPSKLTGVRAAIIGQSVWHYVAQKYGKETVSNLLNFTRITHSDRTSIINTLGISYNQFVQDWRTYYTLLLNANSESVTTLVRKQRARKFNKKGYHYKNIAFNPDSSVVAYAENLRGKYKVYLRNTETGKTRILMRGGHRLVNQQVNYDVPLLSWRNKHELSAIAYRKGKPYLITKHIHSKHKEKKYFETFDEILSFDYCRINDEMVLSGVKNGHSDIYTYNYENNKAIRITKDVYDDLNPRYLPGTQTIVFSSNRMIDSVRGDYGAFDRVTDQYDLFKYDLETKEKVLHRITYSGFNEKMPIPTDSGVFYLAEKDDQIQLYYTTWMEQSAHKLTDLERNIETYAVDKEGKSWSYVAQKKGIQHLYFDEMPALTDTARSYTKMLLTARSKKETVQNEETVLLNDLVSVNINSLRFDGDSLGEYVSGSLDSTSEGSKKKVRIYGPNDYKGLFGADYVASTLQIDQLRGAGILFQIGTGEMLANHRINASILAISDLRSSTLNLQYELLKFRNDIRLKYSRTGVFVANEDIIGQRYTGNLLEAEFSHPFSATTRFVFAPQFFQTRLSDFDPRITSFPDSISNYVALRAEWVYDNTVERGLNQLSGTRFKISGIQYAHGGDKLLNFGRITMDARNYSNIYRGLTLATRFTSGTFFGNSKKNFLLGGMDNWLFSRTNTLGAENPLQYQPFVDNSDVLFVQYVTNMRGFLYNKRYGNNYFLANIEMRIPMVKLFYRKPIRSSFFRHFQFVGFYDVGSAWTGRNPFNQDNNFNVQNVGGNGNPFSAVVTNYRNPVLSSYGLGMRTMVFGYYVKADLAWGVENYIRRKPTFHLTFGYDF